MDLDGQEDGRYGDEMDLVPLRELTCRLLTEHVAVVVTYGYDYHLSIEIVMVDEVIVPSQEADKLRKGG